MPDFAIVAGDIDRTIYFHLRDATTGLAKTGLLFNSLGATASYTLPLAADVAIPLVTQTVTGAHTDGGFVEVDASIAKGLYRFDLPDAAVASGVFTIISIEFDDTIEESMHIPLHIRKVDLTQVGGSATDVPALATNVAGLVLNRTTIATLSTQTLFTLTEGSSNDSAYLNATLIVRDAVTAEQKTVMRVLSYIGSSKTVQVTGAGVFSIDVGDTVTILPASLSLAEIKSSTDILLSDSAAILDDTANILTDTGNILTDTGNILTDTGTNLPTQLNGIEGAGFVTGTDSLAAIRSTVDTVPTVSEIWTSLPLPETYAANGAIGTPAELLYMNLAVVGQMVTTGTQILVKGLDGNTTVMTYSVDSGTSPTLRVRIP